MGSDSVRGFGLKDKWSRSPWKPFTGSDPVHPPIQFEALFGVSSEKLVSIPFAEKKS